VKYGSQSLDLVGVSGATANISDIENIDIFDGRFFIESENDNASRVAFVGADVASNLLPTGELVGREITIGGLPFRVIGVAAAKGTIFGIPQDNFIIIPLKTFVNTYGGTNRRNPYYFVGTAKNDERFNDAVEEVRGLLRLRRRLAQSEKDNFGIRTPDAITGLRDRLFGTISIVAITVPSIALVIGGIVIMNIMLVSVTERTKEIGIRKAIGARQTDILKQFLVEAVTLSAIGGAIGVLIAWLVGEILTAVFFTTYLSIAAIIVAVGVSGIIGVLAGIIPAWKAARLDPIEALRAE
ncbi:MAG: ABC transporter permease, partial [Pyrinomonadaceae bacterium]